MVMISNSIAIILMERLKKAYFEQNGISLDAIKQETFTIHLDNKNILNTKAIISLQEYKDNVLSQLDGYIMLNLTIPKHMPLLFYLVMK